MNNSSSVVVRGLSVGISRKAVKSSCLAPINPLLASAVVALLPPPTWLIRSLSTRQGETAMAGLCWRDAYFNEVSLIDGSLVLVARFSLCGALDSARGWREQH